jgi:hypothetical protein
MSADSRSILPKRIEYAHGVGRVHPFGDGIGCPPFDLGRFVGRRERSACDVGAELNGAEPAMAGSGGGSPDQGYHQDEEGGEYQRYQHRAEAAQSVGEEDEHAWSLPPTGESALPQAVAGEGGRRLAYRPCLRIVATLGHLDRSKHLASRVERIPVHARRARRTARDVGWHPGRLA